MIFKIFLAVYNRLTNRIPRPYVRLFEIALIQLWGIAIIDLSSRILWISKSFVIKIDRSPGEWGDIFHSLPPLLYISHWLSVVQLGASIKKGNCLIILRFPVFIFIISKLLVNCLFCAEHGWCGIDMNEISVNNKSCFICIRLIRKSLKLTGLSQNLK